MTKKDFQGFFEPLMNDTPFVKIGIQGFSGTGKTYLAANLAIGLHKKIKSKKPIVIYDTEKAFRALTDLFQDAGVEVLVKKSRTLADLGKSFDACEGGFSDILIVDSITHVWEAFVQGYMDNKSKRFNRKVTKLSFPDWGYLKPEWKRRFSDRVVNGTLHIIFTGRAGYEYDHEMDESTGKMTELRKTGIRMKAETETAYEPDTLILMERHEELLGRDKKVYRTATVLKDRYRVIDGKTFENPTFEDFKPMIDKALDGSFRQQQEETPDDFSELEERTKGLVRRKEIALEKIENTVPQIGWGTSAKHKKLKLDLLERVFETNSWKEIQRLPVPTIEKGQGLIDDFKKSWLAYIEDVTNNSETVNDDMAYLVMDQTFGPNNAISQEEE